MEVLRKEISDNYRSSITILLRTEGCYVIIYPVLLYGQMASLCDLHIRKIENESKL